MIAISLTRNQTALVDDVDADLAALKWCATTSARSKTFYAARTVYKDDGRRTSHKLHQIIGARMGLIGDIDHRDRNGLNNQRSNLRAATASQNGANRGLRTDNTSGVKGVSWHKKAGKWQVQLMVNGKQRRFGLFIDLSDAASAYDKAALDTFGDFAVINNQQKEV